MSNKTVAIRDNGINKLHIAIGEIISESNKGTAEFYQRISEVNATAFADRGIPAYMPRNRVSRVMTVNAKMRDGAERLAQSDLLRNPDATVEEIKAELNLGEEFTVIPGQILAQLKTEYVEARCNAMEGDAEAFQKFAKVLAETIFA